jgi:outer membrane protein
LSGAELEADLANFDLASFWTAQVADRLALEDALDQPPPVPDADTAPTPYLNRPEFSLLDAARRGFQADARGTRAQSLPQPSLVYQYGLDTDKLSSSNRGSAAFISVNLPIFDWFRTRDAARQFQLRAEQVSVREQTAPREFSREYQNALARIRTLYRQISIAQSQVQSATENLRLSRLRYEGGEGPALEVVTAQTQAGQARSNLYTALANYYIARTDLEVAAGR